MVRTVRRGLGIALGLGLLLAGCGAPPVAAPNTAPSGITPSASSAAAPSLAPATGPTLTVTVPDLIDGAAGSEPDATVDEAGVEPAGEPEPAPAEADAPVGTAEVPEPAGVSPTDRPGGDASEPAADAPPADRPAPPAAEPAPPTAAAPVETVPEPAAAPPPPPPADGPGPAAAPAGGDRVPVSLANCEGCTVLATRSAVTGDLSAALVVSPGGRAILLSVHGDGRAAGVIGVPYGASFPAPADGLLRCDAKGHCAVEARLTDGRAILSVFELASDGAWRDVSGNDAFPSATERAAVLDTGGSMGLAVQEQATGPAVWMLYLWSGDRYTVAGCAGDGDPPAGPAAVSPDACLS